MMVEAGRQNVISEKVKFRKRRGQKEEPHGKSTFRMQAGEGYSPRRG